MHGVKALLGFYTVDSQLQTEVERILTSLSPYFALSNIYCCTYR